MSKTRLTSDIDTILLVSLDSTRLDVIASGRFPTFARLMAQGTLFDRAYCSAPATPISHASVFSARHPPRHGVRHLFREQLPAEIPTLATAFAAAGWRTEAITSCPGLNDWYGISKGFHHYDDEIPRLPDGRDPLQVVDVKLRGSALKRADVVTARAIERIGQAGPGPLFFFAHYFDAHWPYESPEIAPNADIRNAYEGEVAYMDWRLGQLLEALPSLGRDPARTLVIAFADHGEDLGGWYENDHAGDRGCPEEEGHGALLFEPTQRVPILLAGPGLPAGQRLSTPVRLIDIAPTLLEYTGLPPLPDIDGASLTPVIRGDETAPRPVYFETFYRDELAANDPRFADAKPFQGVLLDGRHKVIWEHGSDRAWAFDLQRDPNEIDPVCFGTAQPDFIAPPMRPCAWEDAAQRSAAAALRPNAALFEALPQLRAACENRPHLGVALGGSVVKGTVDTWSDLDVILSYPLIVPPDAMDDAKALLAEIGPVLACFTASHLGFEHLLIGFIDLDGPVAKIDLELVPSDPPPGALVLRPAARAGQPTLTLGPARGAPAPYIPLDAHHKFTGWSWYVASKIFRGELLEADDGLAGMRNFVLAPAISLHAGAPMEGYRFAEQRWPADLLNAFRACYAADLTPKSLYAALQATWPLYQRVAAETCSDPAAAALARMIALIEQTAEGAL